ncbi:MAG: hypothetical protein Solivirus2_8 [Solivirus sp.]|uniref:Calcineurin-like phosphoesterase domain-containing protein n=1 Tax=Solivirus sp. TaxID=2487772 RepID=A0A3G5AFI3_9VIRU|nr:MAG: hypothetical protein Solivirus2_8 [Solivirus sp.]
MKILVIGDLHVTVKNLHIYADVAKEIYLKIEELKPDFVVSLGDTLDTHERIHMQCLCFAVDFYKKIANKVPLIVIQGNHDRQSNSDYMTDIHPFTGLVGFPNITIVSSTIRIKDLVFVPYVPTKRFNEALANTSLEGVKYLFAHQEFKGCRMKKTTSSSGDIWDKSIPIISGHIHEFQTLNNIVYVGSVMQNDYDENPDKALLWMDTEDRTSDQNFGDGGGGSMKRIYLSSIVKKVTVRLTTEQLQRFGEHLPTTSEKILIKVIVTADVVEIAAITKSPAFLACEKIVDKIVFERTNQSASIAKSIIQNSQGREMRQEEVSLEQLVKTFLNEDKESYDLFVKLLEN